MNLPEAIPGVNCAAVVDPVTRKGFRGAIAGQAQAPRSGNMNVPMTAIVGAVCAALRIEPAEFRSTSRFSRVVIARELVSALAADLTRLSYPAIALAMGRPNHSTIIDARERWYNRVERAEKGDKSAYIAVWRTAYEPKALYEKLRAELERQAA
jgi:chromosomal replication initiation ATPase DnaA